MNVWMRNVSTSATTTRIGSSFQNVDRRRLPPRLLRPASLLAVGRGGALVGRFAGPAAVAPGEACGAVVGLLRHGLGGPGEAGRHGGLLHRLGRPGAEPGRAVVGGLGTGPRVRTGARTRRGDVAVDVARRAVGGRQRVPATVLRAADRVDRGQRMAAAVLRTGGRTARPRAATDAGRSAATRPRHPAAGRRERRSGRCRGRWSGWAAHRGRCAAGRGRWRAGGAGTVPSSMPPTGHGVDGSRTGRSGTPGGPGRPGWTQPDASLLPCRGGWARRSSGSSGRATLTKATPNRARAVRTPTGSRASP